MDAVHRVVGDSRGPQRRFLEKELVEPLQPYRNSEEFSIFFQPGTNAIPGSLTVRERGGTTRPRAREFRGLRNTVTRNRMPMRLASRRPVG
jgi:hypothetical protein